jgi:sporulation protein YqfC
MGGDLPSAIEKSEGDVTLRKREKVKREITAALALPKEIVLNLPLISMYGNEELKLENYKGVVEYTNELIRIATSIGILKIEGRGLLLKQVTTEKISVNGVIVKIEFT